MLKIPPGWDANNYSQISARHYTILFNTFVMLQLFNEINCRKLSFREFNVFRGFFNNMMFLVIITFTMSIQIVLVQFGGEPLNCAPLTLVEYLLCIGVGALSLVVTLLLKLVMAGLRRGEGLPKPANPEERPLLPDFATQKS